MTNTLLLLTSATLKGKTTTFSPLTSNNFPSTLTEAHMWIAGTRKPQGCTEERETLETSTDIEETQSSRSKAPTGKMKTPETRPL